MMRFWGRIDKHKKKAEPNIEFVSPYPLEDCVWQLQNFPGVSEWFPIKTRVELSQVDDETYQFNITKTYYNEDFLRSPGRKNSLLFTYFTIKAEGSLRSTGSDQTLVIGQVYLSKHSIIYSVLLILTLFSIIILIFLASNLSKQPYLVGLIIVAVFFLGLQFVSLAFGDRQRYVPLLKSHLSRVLGR